MSYWVTGKIPILLQKHSRFKTHFHKYIIYLFQICAHPSFESTLLKKDPSTFILMELTKPHIPNMQINTSAGIFSNSKISQGFLFSLTKERDTCLHF